jgi:hypothetical protein
MFCCDVQPEIRSEVTRKSWNFFETADGADGFPRWRLTQTPYNWMLDSTRRVPQRPNALPFCIRVIRAIRGEFYFGAGSRLLFLAEFLEARIVPQRIEHWIEPEQRRSERRAHTHCATVRDGE